MSQKQAAVGFFKMGSFSHTNQKVSELLTENFRDHRVEVIDIWDDLISIKNPSLWIHCVKDYFLADLIRNRTFVDSVYRTDYFFSLVRRKALAHIDRENYAFTFQTQSFFDASHPNVPHFLYTDHTHLANLTYPGFDSKKLYPSKWISLEKSIYHNATCNFTMSNHVARSLKEQYQVPEANVQNVLVGANAVIEANAVSRERYAAKNILFVGVAWERKGGPQLLEAFKLVKDHIPNATLTIVGCSPRINDENCHVIGRVPLEEVAQYYDRASLFCLPTRLEPFGIVLIEALSNKLPVVASNIGAIPDFVRDGENGYTVHPDDIESLAARLEELLNDPLKCERFGESGSKFVKERYTWEATGNRIKEKIEQHLQTKGYL